MPRAVTPQEAKTFNLESLPEGFVTIRRMSYGEDLQVRSLSVRMHMQQEEMRRARREAEKEGREPDDIEVEMSVDVRAVTAFQFARTIVDHNLENEVGKKLNFRNRADFEKLDPAIGAEIENYIGEMNPPTKQSKEDDAEDRKAGVTPLETASGEPSTKAI